MLPGANLAAMLARRAAWRAGAREAHWQEAVAQVAAWRAAVGRGARWEEAGALARAASPARAGSEARAAWLRAQARGAEPEQWAEVHRLARREGVPLAPRGKPAAARRAM
jgi:hypothetical protein